MRRLPIYFLFDVSESMAGSPIEQVQEGMRTIIQSLRVDPYALETVFISIIVYAGKAEVLVPLTELYRFYPPVFPIGGGTSLGKGLECLMDEMDRSVRKTTADRKGDWKPIIFLLTDGNPTDDYAAAFRRWNEKYRRHCNLVAISIGDNVNVLTFAQITSDILLLKETDSESFGKFFKWITASIRSTSMSVSAQNGDDVKLASTAGICLEKVNPGEHTGRADENFVVLHGRCQTTGQEYIVKYGRRMMLPGGMKSHPSEDFRLIGAYPIDKERYAALSAGETPRINTRILTGVPACPCCGNQLGVVVCECGNIFCVGESDTNVCPWCGLSGTLGQCDAGGMEITRGLG